MKQTNKLNRGTKKVGKDTFKVTQNLGNMEIDYAHGYKTVDLLAFICSLIRVPAWFVVVLSFILLQAFLTSKRRDIMERTI